MTDAEIVAAVLAGDTERYALLVHRYQDTHRRFATRMLGSEDDADDALQLAFVRAFRALAQCENPARFGAWLFQIVMNECRTFSARRTRRERMVMADESALETAVAPAGVAGDNEMEEIARALGQLDDDQREAFLLKHVEEMSYDEMAELTGVGVSALKMRVKRACDRLKDLLEKVPNG